MKSHILQGMSRTSGLRCRQDPEHSGVPLLAGHSFHLAASGSSAINRLTSPGHVWNKNPQKTPVFKVSGLTECRKVHKKYLFFFLFRSCSISLPLPFIPLMEPDEGRYSAIPSAMNASGDYVTPRLKAAVYFEKPPLAYWATALFFKLFGENEFSSRLFAALCAWGCIILTYRMGIFFHDARTGLFAAAVLSTFLYHAAIGRINILDMPLAFFVCLAIWSGFRYFAAATRRKVWLYLLYLFSALAFLAKGLIGIVFPFGILFIWLSRFPPLEGNLRPFFARRNPALCGHYACPGLILVQQANPDFFRFFFIQEHLLRYATRMHDRYQPIYFYLPIILAGTLPWCAFLPGSGAGHPMEGR